MTKQVATFTNPTDGTAAIVTDTKRGYAVTFLDTDAEAIIETRFYPHDMKAKAIAYAETLTK